MFKQGVRRPLTRTPPLDWSGVKSVAEEPDARIRVFDISVDSDFGKVERTAGLEVEVSLHPKIVIVVSTASLQSALPSLPAPRSSLRSLPSPRTSEFPSASQVAGAGLSTRSPLGSRCSERREFR